MTRSSMNRPATTFEAGSLVVAVVFLAVALVLVLDPWPYKSPVPPPVQVADRFVDTTPVRTPTLRPEIQLAGFTYRCSECHDLFPSPAETFRPLTQHRHIELRHGINTRCFNCHHRTNRNVFIDDFGEAIPFDKPQLLCAKCHGPVYRDWLHGSHGRTNGYWNAEMGPVQRRKCIECHDPHDPPFQAMTPAPEPNTLRMGKTDAHTQEEHGTRNPLLIYRHEDGNQKDRAEKGRDSHGSGNEHGAGSK